MKLRLATNNDFCFCKTIRNIYEADMLYHRRSQVEVKKEPVNERKIEDYIDAETLARIEEDWKLTKEKFEAALTKNYERVFIICDDNNQRIGYFFLFLIEPYKPIKRKGTINRWKLAEMYLLEDRQDFSIFHEAIELLLKQELIQVIDVCIPYEEETDRFERAGFEPTGKVLKSFLRKKREQSE